MDIFLNSEQIEEITTRCAGWIADLIKPGSEVAIVGIRSRGVVLANRFTKIIQQKIGQHLPLGVLDITLYRDDLDDPHSLQQPEVRSTEIDFDINGKIIVLVDDVLYTGRTIRAAMDALMEYGRPAAIRLAVMIDRGGRELPIQPDFVGRQIEIKNNQSVYVNFVESDDVDQVSVE